MFIIFGMLTFLLFKNKLFACIAVSVYFLVFIKQKRTKESVLLILLCLILILSHNYLPDKETYSGKVDKLHSYGFTLKGKAYRIYVSGDYNLGLGDKVKISGELEKESSPSFNRHIGKIHDATIIKHKKRMNLKKIIYKHFPKQFEMLFDSDSDHIINSLGLQLMGVFAIYQVMYRRFFGTLKYEAIFLYTLSFLFGKSFVWYRLMMRTLKVPTNYQIVVLLIMFPNAMMSPSFIYSYSLYLLSEFSDEFDHFHPSLLFAQLSLFFFNEWHALMLFVYPILKYLAGVYVLLILIACFINPVHAVLLNMQSIGEVLIASAFYQRFLIRGNLHFLSFFILLFSKTRKDHLVIFLILIIFITYPPFARITYIDVGQGDSTLVSLPFNSSHYLIDTGRAYAYNEVKRALSRHGVFSLDYLVLTHDDADHVENKNRIIKDFKPKIVMEDKNQTIDFMHSHLQDTNFGDDNEDSIILSFNLHNIRYLLLGDAHKKQEELIMKRNPDFKVDILKLGHHGSDTSTSNQLLKLSNPKFAIISSRPSMYNHPRPEVMRRLYNHDVLPLQTSIEGDITIYSTAILQWIKTSRGSFAIIGKGD